MKSFLLIAGIGFNDASKIKVDCIWKSRGNQGSIEYSHVEIRQSCGACSFPEFGPSCIWPATGHVSIAGSESRSARERDAGGFCAARCVGEAGFVCEKGAGGGGK